jgi:hypothetical protein
MEIRTIRDRFRNIPHDLSQLAGIHLVEKAVELDMLRHGWARPQQLNVMFDRVLKMRNRKTVVRISISKSGELRSRAIESYKAGRSRFATI